jgi:HSP20 family protein
MLMRTDPFRDFDRLFEQVTGTPARPAAMPIDAYRHGEEFTIQFDLPGVSTDAVEVTVEKNVLTVKAERSLPHIEGAETLVRERPYGSFSRRLFLGDSLDTERLEASYADGVLTVTIPVAERAKARKIAISGAAASPAAIDTHSKAQDDDLVGANAN